MSLSTTRIAIAAGSLFALTACERDEVQVYVAPKDMPPPAAPAPTPQPASAQAPARPAPPPKAWDAPQGWQSTDPGQVSVANFVLKTDQGEASINVTPLPNMAGKEELVVNLWRQQVGQEPLEGDAVTAALKPIPVGKEEGKAFEISGSREGKPSLIVTAMLHEENVSWFFKLSGDQAVVEAQKPTFYEFLKSVRPAEGAAAAPATTSAAPAPAETAPQFKWEVPQGWEQVSPGAMQVAKFKVPEVEGAKAELAVSVFPSDTGGTLANVNRWRGQLGMAPVDEAGLAEVAKPLDPAIPNSTLVDLTNEGRQMLGAIVPRENRWWFYKLMGDARAVAAARDAFIDFSKKQP